jgi:hypothetical protein
MGGNGIANTPRLRIRRAWIRIWILLLCGTLTAQPVWSQNANAPTRPGSGQSQSGSGSAPDRLQIKILSTVPMTEPAGALSANQITVQVVDGWGMPVARAAVSFRLPEAGPGGVFLNGLGTEVVITDEQGKASVQGFDWRAETGTSFLHVIAAYGSIRTGAMVEVHLGRRVSELPPAATAAAPKRTGSPQAAEPPPAGLTTPPASESAAFPLPREASARKAPETPDAESRPPAREAYVKPLPKAPRAIEPGEAPPAYANAVATVVPAPRKAAEATGDSAEGETASYVTVKKRSGGGSKTLLFLVVAAAAAGGALAAGMAGGGSSGSSGTPSTPATPTISIGSPTITVSGGTN